jgi:hypothetical protein
MLEKQGFTSSEDVRIRFDSWAKSQDKKYFGEYEHPVHSYFPDANMYFLCVFFVHSTILVISNCVFGFNPGFYFIFVLKSQSLALYSFVVVILLAFVFEYYFISRKDKAKKLFKQFDKWKQPKLSEKNGYFINFAFSVKTTTFTRIIRKLCKNTL